MEAEIRRAAVSDIPALASLYVEFHNFHAVGVPSRLLVVGPPDAELREAIGKILDNAQAAIFVACLESDVVGFVEIYLRESEPTPAVVQRKYVLLQSLAVTESMRQHGLGARLVAAAHQWARENGATEIELNTWEFPAGPLGFYERLGYTTVKRTLVSRV